MQFLVRKYAWIVKLLIIAVVAILLAVALNRVIAIFLAPLTVPEIALEKPQKKNIRTTSSRLKNLATPIKKRCFFGCAEEVEIAEKSDCPQGCAEGEFCQDSVCIAIQEGGDSSLPIKSDLNGKLLGVMVARSPKFSTALMKSEEQTFVVGIGETIIDAEIVEIHRDRVIVRRNGRLEYIKLENSIGGNPGRSPVSLTSGLSRAAMDLKPSSYTTMPIKKLPKVEKIKGGVEKISPTEFRLDRAVLEKELTNRQRLASEASIAPNYDSTGTKRNGIKLMGVRSGSIYQKLGIQSNDIITKINGTKISSQAHALELLTGLKGKNQASIEIERKGKSKVFKYKVKK